MEPLRLKPRPAVEDDVENWDDDDFMIESDNISLHSHSTNQNPPSNRRDSHSSFRSDFESISGEEEKHVHLPGDDEKSTLEAIAAAARAGIPLPTNVPPSALTGGTIKRLGGRKIKQVLQEDWDEDLVLPETGQSLSIKPQDASKFPDTLRQVSSSVQASPIKSTKPSPVIPLDPLATLKPKALASAINLDRFRDADEDDDDFFGGGSATVRAPKARIEDDDLFGDGLATIKVPKRRQAPQPVSLITPPTPQKKDDDDGFDNDFETDFELPSNGRLTLSSRKDIPKTPSMNALEDFDWGEGSLGTRFGGTRRDARSNRSSSVSALSPSVASTLTAESEDEAMDGLVLPSGPLDLKERLQRRRKSRSPERKSEVAAKSVQPVVQPVVQPSEPATPLLRAELQPQAEKDDVLGGLDIGDGDIFDSRKLTLHKNIQVRQTRPTSPSRPKTAVALKFTNKPVIASRLPRPMGPPPPSHERSHTQSSLEPVSESGGPIPQTRRSLSRLGHSAQSSISSVHTPTTPLSAPPSTPRRREIGKQSSVTSLRNEPTTTNAQLLRVKRSLPVMRPPQSPARPAASTRGYDRPPSRTEYGARPPSSLRPKTPVERGRTPYESAASQARKPPPPFMPAGASSSQSHNVNAKSSRTFRRHDSDHSIDFRPSSRAVSRSTMRSPSPRKGRYGEKVGQEGSWGTFNRPRRTRTYGDGHELDGFDDLPTSAHVETKFMKQPLASGPKLQLRNKVHQNILPDRTGTPQPLTPYSPARSDRDLPHFARDTTASRIARETALAQRAPSGGPLAQLTVQRVAQLSTRSNLNPHYPAYPAYPAYPSQTVRPKKTRKMTQSKPHLITNMNTNKDSKMINGMVYNPMTFRWEGNENALNAFEAPASSPSTASMPPFFMPERQTSTPRPALITNINTTKGVQVVGGMLFDPHSMRWIKNPESTKPDEEDPMEGFNALDDEEEDVFKDIPDLEEKKDKGKEKEDSDGSEKGGNAVDGRDGDWPVGEEFDVGPEFVRRLREEEVRWRKRLNPWVDPETGLPLLKRDKMAWRHSLRDIVKATTADQ